MVDALQNEAQEARTDVAQGQASTTEMERALDEQQAQVGGLTAVTQQGPALQQSVAAIDPESPTTRQSVDSEPNQQLEKTKIAEAEQKLKEEEQQESSAGVQLGGRATPSTPSTTPSTTSSTPTTSSTRTPQLAAQTMRVQRQRLAHARKTRLAVQRANIFKRFAGWVKGKFSSLFGRFSSVAATMKTKMGAIALRLMGAKKFQAGVTAGVAEQKARVSTTTAALGETGAAVEGYDESLGQLRELTKTGGGAPPQAG